MAVRWPCWAGLGARRQWPPCLPSEEGHCRQTAWQAVMPLCPSPTKCAEATFLSSWTEAAAPQRGQETLHRLSEMGVWFSPGEAAQDHLEVQPHWTKTQVNCLPLGVKSPDALGSPEVITSPPLCLKDLEYVWNLTYFFLAVDIEFEKIKSSICDTQYSKACWKEVCLYSGPLPILNQISFIFSLFLLLSCMSLLYILVINPVTDT